MRGKTPLEVGVEGQEEYSSDEGPNVVCDAYFLKVNTTQIGTYHVVLFKTCQVKLYIVL
jgi:hypothetical protein